MTCWALVVLSRMGGQEQVPGRLRARRLRGSGRENEIVRLGGHLQAER